MPRQVSKKRDPLQLYLFDEIPVTWPEVWEWIERVAGISRDSWRADYYIEYWNVVEKIRPAKRNRNLSAVLE